MNYKIKGVATVPVNHKRYMKKMYNRFGQQGVDKYITAVKKRSNELALKA